MRIATMPSPCPRSSAAHAHTRHSAHLLHAHHPSRRAQQLLLPAPARQACIAAAKKSGSGSAAVAEPAEPITEGIEDRELHVEASESYLAVRVCVLARQTACI